MFWNIFESFVDIESSENINYNIQRFCKGLLLSELDPLNDTLDFL